MRSGPTRTRIRRRRAWAAAAAAGAGLALSLAGTLLAPGRATSAPEPRVVDVRTGLHDAFVRVVIETDEPAAHELEARTDPRVLRVHLAASAQPARVEAPGAGAVVRLEPAPEGGTLAAIEARGPVRLERQVLDGPPRLVLDLWPATPDEALAAAQAAPLGEEGAALRPAPPAAEAIEAGEPGGEAAAPAPGARERAALPRDEAADAGREAEALRPPADADAEAPRPPEAADRPQPAPAALPPRDEAAVPVREPAPVAAPPPREIEEDAVPDRMASTWVIAAAAVLLLGVLLAVWRRSRRARAEERPGAEAPPLAPEGPAPHAPAPAPEAPPSGAGATAEPAAEGAVEAPGEAPAGAAGPVPPDRDRPQVAAEPALLVAAAGVSAPDRDEPGAAPGPPPPERDALTTDVLTMIRDLDRRFAALEQEVAQLREATTRLSTWQASQGEELAAQRVALARIDRALRRRAAPSLARPGPGPRPPV